MFRPRFVGLWFEGMVGAAVLAAGAALRSGCGLVTVHLPREERVALQANHPAAMVSGDEQPCFSHLPNSPSGLQQSVSDRD